VPCCEHLEEISNHIARQIGTVGPVLHELVSDIVHVDVHVVPPGQNRDRYTLITSGMSDRAMAAPREAGECRFAELMLCVPPD
jgi:hypothetical protein